MMAAGWYPWVQGFSEASMAKHRTQVLCEGKQYDRLAKMANEQGSSVSAVIRELVE